MILALMAARKIIVIGAASGGLKPGPRFFSGFQLKLISLGALMLLELQFNWIMVYKDL